MTAADLPLTQRTRTRRGEIAYGVLGEGPPVVLVHGTPSRALIWRNVAAALSATHRVHVFDLLGFGDSERHVEQDVSIAAHADALSELIGAWGLDRPAVVAHDIGGAVVLRAHLVEGVPFERIALVDAVVVRPWITPRTREMQRDTARYRPLPSAELATTIADHLRSATSRELDRDVYAALFGQWDGEHGQALYLRNLEQLDERDTADFEDHLPEIDVPVHLVWGEEDRWLDVTVSERIVRLIPRAERTLIPGAGHFSMEDEPDAVSAALADFLGR